MGATEQEGEKKDRKERRKREREREGKKREEKETERERERETARTNLTGLRRTDISASIASQRSRFSTSPFYSGTTQKAQ